MRIIRAYFADPRRTNGGGELERILGGSLEITLRTRRGHVVDPRRVTRGPHGDPVCVLGEYLACHRRIPWGRGEDLAMASHGRPRLAMVCHGLQWLAVAGHGLTWFAMVCHGLLWLAVVGHGVGMARHGMPWQAMTGHGVSWRVMASHGRPWFAMACRGLPRLAMA